MYSLQEDLAYLQSGVQPSSQAYMNAWDDGSSASERKH